MAGKRVLIIGWGDVAKKHFRQILTDAPSLERLAICDSDAREPEVPNATFVQVKIEDPLCAEATEILGMPWDFVFILTPPHNHSELAQLIAKHQLAIPLTERGGRISWIIIEKPIDSNLERAQALARWEQALPADCPVRFRVIDHYWGKWAINELAAEYASRQPVTLDMVIFLSFEEEPLWESPCFDDGYFLEHAVHAFAALQKVTSISTPLSVGELLGGRYPDAPTERDTFASVTYRLGECEDRPGVPFTIVVGKSMPQTEKWLHIVGKNAEGERIRLWADIRRRVLWASYGEDCPAKLRSSTSPDGYEGIVPRILEGSTDELIGLTLSVQQSLKWLEAVCDPLCDLWDGLVVSFTDGRSQGTLVGEAIRATLSRALPPSIQL